MPPSEDYSIAELVRMTTSAMQRLESLAQRLEGGQFVRSDLFNEYRENVNQSLRVLQDDLKSLEKDKTEYNLFQDLARRVKNLEDGRTWLVRIVGAFLVVGLLQVIFTGITLAQGVSK